MAITQDDVIKEALAWLRVIEIGETPAADEAAAALTVLQDLVAEWVRRRVTQIDLANVQPENVQPMMKILGNRIGPKFGRPYDADIDLREESRLRENQTQFTRRRGVGAVAL